MSAGCSSRKQTPYLDDGPILSQILSLTQTLSDNRFLILCSLLTPHLAPVSYQLVSEGVR